MAHLRGPRLNVSGVTVPGLPGIVAGHNDRVAWSITNLEADTQDLYVEKLNPANGLYEFAGRVEQARAEPELIRVKGGAPENLVVWVTRHGPVLVTDGGRFLSLRWMASDAANFQLPLLDIDRSRNWEEFRGALARLSGAGAELRLCGHHRQHRRRPRASCRCAGVRRQHRWTALPASLNGRALFRSTTCPPSLTRQRMIVPANQDPFPPDSSHRISGYYAAPYQYRQIRDRLRLKQQWKAEEMLSIQMDIYSGFAHFLAREIVAAYSRRGSSYPALADAVRL
jgi:penicillin amidase